MENLLKFNFLKGIDAKKNNTDNNTNNLLKGEGSKENPLIINNVISENNNFNDLINENNLTEELNAPVKQKKRKTNKNIELENTELLAVESNIKILDDDKFQGLNETRSNNTSKSNNVKNKVLNNFVTNKIIDKDNNKLLNPEKETFNHKAFIDNFENNKKVSSYMGAEKSLNTSKINKKSKIKSLFQNYFNYASKKYTKKNINLKKSNFESIRNLEKNILKEPFINDNTANIKIDDNKNFINENKSQIKFENINKDHNNISDNSFKLNSEKNITNQKENTFENFDRLKNILDIQSNDIKQRFSQILENNIKVNKNKFEIQLRPENLGKIHITLEISGQNVDININSDNINAIQTLTENNSNLQKMLQNHGMNLNNFNFNGNNNKEAGKDHNKAVKQENNSDSISVNENNNDEDSFVSNKLVYVKA